MLRAATRLPLALIVFASLLWPAASVAGASSALAGSPIRSVYVRAPFGATTTSHPLQVLVALHGMGGNGSDFARDLINQADQYGWLIVAPTINYGDWKDPAKVAAEDPMLIRALADYLDQLPQLTGFTLRNQVLLLGHSRGAQLAHRFAEFRPDRVLAVAAISAGTYTLPLSASGQGNNLSFPYGVKDLDRYGGKAFDSVRFGGVQFWLGVGGDDTNAGDLPRQWDPFEGTTRVQRAQAFDAAMRKLGANAILRVFGGTKHDLTSEMRGAACAFLERAAQPHAPLGTPVSATPRSA